MMDAFVLEMLGPWFARELMQSVRLAPAPRWATWLMSFTPGAKLLTVGRPAAGLCPAWQFPRNCLGARRAHYVRDPESFRLRSATDLALLAHELTHVEQYARHGLLGFLWRYVTELVRAGYHGICYEQAAYARQYEIEETLKVVGLAA